MGNIGFTSVETSAPTQTSVPIETSEPQETSSSFQDWVDSIPDNYIPEDTLLPSDSYYNQDVLDFNYNNKDNV